MAGSYRDTNNFSRVIQNAVNFFPSCGIVSVCRKIPFSLISHLRHLATGFMHPRFVAFPLRGSSSDVCTINHVYANYPLAL